MTNPNAAPRILEQAEACIDWLLDNVGKDLRVAAPLGLGKPNTLLNSLYQRALADPGISLHLFTALTLATPRAGSALEARLLEPINQRLFSGYPDLDYYDALRSGQLPANVRVTEFFFQPGTMLGAPQAQQDYLCSNYTHVGRDLIRADINVFMQLVAPTPDSASPGEYVAPDGKLSLSSNPDVTLELLPHIRALRAAGKAVAVIGQIHQSLPYMQGDAEVSAGDFDLLFSGEAAQYRLFGTPAVAVSAAEHAIGLQASALLRDGGTLQIGIGALADAIAHAASLRQQRNADYQQLLDRMPGLSADLVSQTGGTEPFARGLYGCTEMLVEAYLHMQRAGIIARTVFPDAGLQQLMDEGLIDQTPSEAMLDALVDAGLIESPLRPADVDWLRRLGVLRDDVSLHAGKLVREGIVPIEADLSREENLQAIGDHCLGHGLTGATLIHAGFFLGREQFYAALRDLPAALRAQICMTSVARVNQLYGDEALRVAQRRHARFINTALKVTLLGAVVSDGLESGQVLSGVGGQYNFVAQAHALPEARSIICVRATRGSGRSLESNVVWRYGHCTVPRHLRDIVITEYGVADLRGRTDAQVIAALIAIADSRFQPALCRHAINAGKLPADFALPEWATNNYPQTLARRLSGEQAADWFPAFPYGSEFSDEEITLARALRKLAACDSLQRLGASANHLHSLLRPPPAARPFLQRMGLAQARGLGQILQQRAVVLALAMDGALG